MKNIIILFVFLFVFISAYVSYSQWKDVGWPKDASINAMITINNKIIIGSQNGIHYSTDQGITWEKTNLSNTINSFALSANVIVASNTGGAIYISSDEGYTWSLIYDNLFKNGISSLFIDGNNIIAGAYFSAEINFSTDLGNSWELKSQGLPKNKDLSISSIEKDDNNNIFVSIRNAFGSGGGGLYLSTDMGNTWSVIGFMNQNVSKAFFNGGKLFAYSSDKLHSSFDMGKTWIPVEFDVTVRSIITDGDKIYVGTFNGIYFSEDNGLTWSGKGLNNQSIHSISLIGNRIIASTSLGIYMYDEQNKTWEQIYKVMNLGKVKFLSVYDSKIFAGNEDKIYHSSNMGVSWEEINTNDIEAVSLDVINGKIYKGTNLGLYISTDYGLTWVKQNTNDDSFSKTKITSVVNYDKTIFVATNIGIFISEDNGQNWHFDFNELTGRNVKSLILMDDQLFAAARNVYISKDMGKSWVVSNNGLPLESPTSPHLATDGLSKVIAGYQGNGENSGVYLSNNRGDSWEYISKDGFLFNNMQIKEIVNVFTNDNYIFASPQNMGVFTSDDNGKTWNSINEGLTNLNINSFEKIGDYIIIGTNDGFYRAKMSDIIETDVKHTSKTLSHLIFPNPAIDYVEITLDNEAIQFTNMKVQIFDVFGREVSQSVLIDGNTKIDVSFLPSGVYFVKIGSRTEKFVKI